MPTKNPLLRPTLRQGLVDVNVERHARLCTICKHEFRDEIENNYLEWETIESICNRFNVNDNAIFRHVKALGLDMKKLTERKRFYLKIMERTKLDDISATEGIAAGKLVEQLEGKIEQAKLSPEDRDKFYDEILSKIEAKKEELKAS